MLKNYQFISNFRSPVLTPTGNGGRPHKVMYKAFRKGEVCTGRVHKVNGVDTCILMKDQYVVPFDVVRALSVESTSKASGNAELSVAGIASGTSIKKASRDYTRSIFVGGLLGLLTTMIAEHQNYIQPQPKNKMFGVFLGAALLGYITYEHNKHLQKENLPKIA
jgi:hypothetical protein